MEPVEKGEEEEVESVFECFTSPEREGVARLEGPELVLVLFGFEVIFLAKLDIATAFIKEDMLLCAVAVPKSVVFSGFVFSECNFRTLVRPFFNCGEVFESDCFFFLLTYANTSTVDNFWRTGTLDGVGELAVTYKTTR